MYKSAILLFCAAVFIMASTSAQTKFAFPSAKGDLPTLNIEVDHARLLPQEVVSWPTADDDCSNTVDLAEVIDQWGFFAGMNGFGDLGKGQVLSFDGSPSYAVIGGVGFFAPPSVVGDGEISAQVYTLNADGVPTTMIVASNPIKVSELVLPDSFIQPTIFTFPAEANMAISDPSFLLNIDFTNAYSTGDTVSLFHTVEDCGSGDDTWEKWSDGSWVQYSSVDGWESNIDLYIEAIVDFPDPTSTDAFISKEGLTLYPASPNPAQSHVGINYEIEDYQDIEINIFDAQGKIIKEINRNKVHGQQTEHIDLTGFSSGVYYYTIRTNAGQITSRFSKK